MSRRFPNEPLWQLTEAAFREIAGRSWRTTAAERGGVERKDLRACVDRHMTPDEITQVDKFLIDSLEQHIRDLDRRRARATSLIAEIQHASYERVTSEIETGTVDDAHVQGMLDARPMIDWFFRQLIEDPVEKAA
jgi:hypothetical protein